MQLSKIKERKNELLKIFNKLPTDKNEEVGKELEVLNIKFLEYKDKLDSKERSIKKGRNNIAEKYIQLQQVLREANDRQTKEKRIKNKPNTPNTEQLRLKTLKRLRANEQETKRDYLQQQKLNKETQENNSDIKSSTASETCSNSSSTTNTTSKETTHRDFGSAFFNRTNAGQLQALQQEKERIKQEEVALLTDHTNYLKRKEARLNEYVAHNRLEGNILREKEFSLHQAQLSVKQKEKELLKTKYYLDKRQAHHTRQEVYYKKKDIETRAKEIEQKARELEFREKELELRKREILIKNKEEQLGKISLEVTQPQERILICDLPTIPSASQNNYTIQRFLQEEDMIYEVMSELDTKSWNEETFKKY